MKAEIVNLTPALCAEMLKNNTGNRPLTRGTVDFFKGSLERGEYIPTHQGIAFSATGRLLDGQHRLTAIMELGRGEYPMLVVTGLPDEAFKAMDIGKKRSASEALGIDDRRLVEAARLIAVISCASKMNPSPAMLLPFIDAIRVEHHALTSFAPATSKLWSSTPVRIAAIISMKRGNPDYVMTSYRAMVLADFDSMSPVARSLFKAGYDGKLSAADRGDLISRCLTIFNPKMAANSKVQVREPAAGLEVVREMFGHLLPREKKIAAVAAVKGGLQVHSKPARFPANLFPGVNMDAIHSR